MDPIIAEILREHKGFKVEIGKVDSLLARIVEATSENPKAYFATLQLLTEVYGTFYLFTGKFTMHQEKEERLVYPRMEDRSLAEALIRDHERINKILETVHTHFENYRQERETLEHLKNRTLTLIGEANRIITEHAKKEEEEFPKIDIVGSYK